MAEREAVRVLVFSASLRAESLNTRLVNLARGVIENHGMTVELATMKEFDCPSYDQDAQRATGFPPGAEHLGARMYPDMFSLAQAHQAFAPDGRIANQKLADRLDKTFVGFLDLVEAAKRYPCVKKAWVEFLGEHPDAATDRSE